MLTYQKFDDMKNTNDKTNCTVSYEIDLVSED